MDKKLKLEYLAEVLEIEPNSLSENMLLSSLPNFDSMAKLSLIVLFDDKFKKKLTNEEIKKFVYIQDIMALMF
jgi:acyl carrier protein